MIVETMPEKKATIGFMKVSEKTAPQNSTKILVIYNF
jgi:hypothetical protein